MATDNTQLKQEHETASFGDKLYFAPESYHALRKEMQQNFPTMWHTIGGALFWAPETFFGYMSEALETFIHFDTRNVDGLCKHVLDLLREKRGLKPLHSREEYYIAESQRAEDRVVVENGTIVGTVGDLAAKREI